jgi:hypothetical protein
MATVTLTVGTQISFGDHAGDFAGGAAKTSIEQGTPTDVQLSLASVANTAGRESANFDFGANRAPKYSIMATLEFAATPTSGAEVELYLAPSPDATAANGNPMQIDGADAAAPSGIGTLAELVAACKPIGTFKCTDDATTNVQVAYCGTFSPPERYGILIVKNESGAAIHSDDVECNIIFTPISPDVS